jgi:basic membrane protein A and related proteins
MSLSPVNNLPGKEAATSIIRRGADFMFHVADSSGQGVIQAAKENGIYALGAVQDQNSFAPETVLTSFVLDTNKAYDNAVKLVRDDNFTGGIFRPGIELRMNSTGDGVVYIAPFHDLDGAVPNYVKQDLKDLINQILEGNVVVPERLG